MAKGRSTTRTSPSTKVGESPDTIGKFFDGKKHGEGEFKDKNGRIIKEVWENGRIVERIEPDLSRLSNLP